MEARALLEAATRLKQGLLAKATDGEYRDSDFQSDISILTSDQRVEKMLPVSIRANRSTSDFRRDMQAKFNRYAERRSYINEELNPIFEYLDSIQDGTDSFSYDPLVYDVGERLGNGGFGAVYKYHHRLLDMDFAIKLFEPIFVSNQENIEGENRFFREAKILFSLNHENIVRVYDIGRANGQPFIRMEYVDGYTLQDFVTKHGTVSFDRSVKPITALLSGLSCAHSVGIIHRDLKPTNFMVTKEGKFKIIDFEISAFLETENHTKLTKTGESVVGGAYTDPRLMENPKLRDIRSDIYSVGAIWYYLLVGHSPVGADVQRVLMQSGNVTELQCSIVLKCLSSDPNERFQTCDELLSILMPQHQENANTNCGKENRITEVTREAIFDYLIDRNREELNAYVYQQTFSSQEPERVFYYSGRRDDLTFLSRLYDVENLPSDEALTFENEIIKHTIRNHDFEYGWVFHDSRLHLDSGSDENLLKFLCEMFHPVVRSEESDWESVKEDINNLLRVDGYEIYETGKISGRSVFSYRYCI